MGERRRFYFKVFLAFFAVPIIWFLVSKCTRTGILIENATIDFRFWCRGNIDKELYLSTSNDSSSKVPKIIYVGVDDKSIESIGAEPIPFSHYAETIKALNEYGSPKVIASDTNFVVEKLSPLVNNEIAENDVNSAFGIFSKYKNIVFSAWYKNFAKFNKNLTFIDHTFPLIKNGFIDIDYNQHPNLPDAKLVSSSNEIGLTNFYKNEKHDKCVRFVPLYAKTKERTYFTLSLETARLYLSAQPSAIIIYGDDRKGEVLEGIHKIVLLGTNGYKLLDIPLYERQLCEVNWFSKWDEKREDYINSAEVLKQKIAIQSGSAKEKDVAVNFFKDFNNAIVLFGLTNTHSKCKINTPVDREPVPSIFFHGNLLKTIFSGWSITRPSNFLEFTILFIINALVACFALYSEFWGKLNKLFVFTFISYFVAAILLFGIISASSSYILPVGSVICSTSTILICGVIYQLIIERRQRIRIKSIFGNYLSPEVVAAMVEEQAEPQLGGLERNITAFFSDIQSFSSFSEVLSPASLVSLMNEYLTVATEVIKDEGGTLDKFIGDAVVAMFGAPLSLEAHQLRACVAACRIQQKQAWLRDKWKKESEKWPKEILRMRTRIGLSSGLAIVGNMGSATRFNYTMMGDTVNLAARCESGAKTYGVYTLISEDTYKAAVAENNEVVFRFIDRIVVKGRTQPIGIYEIVGLRKELPDSAFECIDVYEKAITKYLARDWDGATSLFEKASTIELLRPGRDVGVLINPSILFSQRCKYMKETPPDKNWDGVFIMQSK